MSMRRILVTGLSGLIGGALRKHVEGKYALRALNRRAVPGVETHQADLGDLAAIQPAFRDVDTVVHLAAAAGDKHAADVLMRSNVVGPLNVIEAPKSLRFDVFYVVSNLRHGYRDVEHARTVLGWTPMDSADTPR